ncbi:glycosyltransferase family 4 protein [Reichenbachiella agarivorans]|uniref:Glycosyltransferase family 4 protein n=1 Tax=Reichenbachiella agarivorans TaxID=2979464 RepID=A0ABY6CMF0_9BACT|nr:glycosyltransferase family 4 protein [Reichenbachiella agarivorans]UXP30914.1 glycosyltransferase family 4 protein [Reichenbachiella agarivorans]
MNVDFITQDFPPALGGIQTYSAELVTRLNQMGMSVTVHAPNHEGAQTLDQSLDYKVCRYNVPNPYLGARLLFGYKSHLEKNHVDVVFHAQWQTTIASIRAKRNGAKIRIFCAAHARELFLNPLSLSKSGQLSARFVERRKRLFQQVDHFFPVSNYTASLLIDAGVKTEKITVIPNGTNPQRFFPSDGDGKELRKKLGFGARKIIYSISRLVPTKGIDTILDAMPLVIKKHSDALYVIGGTGPDEQRLKTKVMALGLSNHVFFTGRIADDQLNAYYNMADVFVMVSRQEKVNVEGFGIVFLEANACEKPVIGSYTGGIPDAVLEGETGFLVGSDDTQTLSERINQLMSNEELSLSMGKKGRDRVLSQFNWDTVANRLYTRMKELMEE